VYFIRTFSDSQSSRAEQGTSLTHDYFDEAEVEIMQRELRVEREAPSSSQGTGSQNSQATTSKPLIVKPQKKIGIEEREKTDLSQNLKKSLLLVCTHTCKCITCVFLWMQKKLR
jgi:hypothetical protein